ncbi:uncharacterized protein LOC111633629 isoform X1 [Centruroides sculpturatus]|uniref:uncharacterized protein LOC111633629 isoform X1 n=1 Tax=Centruroides sculpturatus TaxID=218467 RepID=UPI000C6DF9ED|nr:uncharacterized protein LOC111633629 isoform X1 [Centruroides sculpturatus]
MSNMFGESSIVVFLAIFGGSTLLLFLLCFCCQRKLKPDNSTIEVPPEVVHANHQNSSQQRDNSGRQYPLNRNDIEKETSSIPQDVEIENLIPTTEQLEHFENILNGFQRGRYIGLWRRHASCNHKPLED